MSVSYRIINDANLCLVRFTGHISFNDTAALHVRYRADPDFSPTHRHLMDMSVATSVDSDFVDMMRLQAAMVETVVKPAAETLGVFLAPNETAQRLANLAARGWRDIPGVVVRIVDSEAAACTVLGLSPDHLRELLSEKT